MKTKGITRSGYTTNIRLASQQILMLITTTTEGNIARLQGCRKCFPPNGTWTVSLKHRVLHSGAKCCAYATNKMLRANILCVQSARPLGGGGKEEQAQVRILQVARLSANAGATPVRILTWAFVLPGTGREGK